MNEMVFKLFDKFFEIDRFFIDPRFVKSRLLG